MGDFISCPECGSSLECVNYEKNIYVCPNPRCNWISNENDKKEPTVYDLLAEDCTEMFSAFKNKGFTREEAFTLTRDLIKIAVFENQRKHEETKREKLNKAISNNRRRSTKDQIEEVNDLNRKREDEAWKRAIANNGL